jgi:aminomethyltransferase
MSEAGVTSRQRPKIVAPGTASLDPGVERYIVKGGGSGVFALERDDWLELSVMDAGQTVEIAVFGESGKSDLAALGLKGRGKPDGIKAILAGDSEDAARVRFGLFRRDLDIGRAHVARLFGPDIAAGEIASLQCERPAVAVIAAPGGPMTVWDQDPPGDVLVFIRRARPPAPGLLRLPEPLAEPRLDLTINIASAISFDVHEGEYIQIIDVAGRQCSDFLAFHRKSLDKGRVLGIDSTTTRTMLGIAYPRPGLHSKFFDNDQNALVEVIQDTVGRHDTFGLACTKRFYEDMGYFGHVSCSENLNAAMAPSGIQSMRGWPAINLFFNTNVDANNNIWFDEPWSRPGDYVLMRALSDLVCGATSCPDDIDPANGWNLTEIQVRVYPKTANFKRAIGYRMSADAPLQLTRETGFHPRTSELTRSFTEYRGFWLPTCFSKNGPIDEYWACRERVVVMDLSPLRKLEINGPDAESFLNRIFTRDIRKLAVGQIFYTPLCYEHGGMIDDGTLFRMSDTNFRWIGGDDASILWIKEQAAKSGAKVLLKTASDQIHNVAVQGPKSRDTLRETIWTAPGRPTLDELGVFRFTVGRIGGYEGIPIVLSRTGYTGELGYEVFCHPKDAPAVWDAIMAAGEKHGIAPMGFTALDMVRIEAGLVFGGHDFDSTTDPLEAGISFTVPSKKEDDYIGKAAVAEKVHRLGPARCNARRNRNSARNRQARRPPEAPQGLGRALPVL